MSTIIAHTFLTHQRRPSMQVAGMLLCAILSDTLNLQGPTTTECELFVCMCTSVDRDLLASNRSYLFDQSPNTILTIR